MKNQFERQMIETPIISDFFTVQGLQKQTGQSYCDFGNVVIKELMDNSLDASEYAGVNPDVTVIKGSGPDNCLLVSVTDNGTGIDPDTISKILNYDTRTSDKAVYRTCSRGAQGNALKTIVGIPCALKMNDPITIESKGLRHSIKATINPAGRLHIDYQQDKADIITGTKITVPLPAKMDVDVIHWCRGMSLFNPHGSFLAKYLNFEEYENENNHDYPNIVDISEFYQNSVNGNWRKFKVNDRASAWWYDKDSFLKLIYALPADYLLRDFVRQFHKLSSTELAKTICEQFPQKRLSEIRGNDDEDIIRLLKVLHGAADQIQAKKLGIIGKDHFHRRFNDCYGIKRFWYEKLIHDDAIPYVCELAVATTERPADIFTGINFGLSLDDPMKQWEFQHIHKEDVFLCGMESIRDQLHNDSCLAVAFHVASPGLQFTDYGKTSFVIPEHIAAKVYGMVEKVTADLYKEKKRREKASTRREKESCNVAKDNQISMKEAVFNVIPDAAAKARGDEELPVGARSLFYQIRPAVQKFTDKDLLYSYCSQNLLTEYRQTVGEIPGLYYDPRGTMYEPHTGKSLLLGTREVERYEFPEWRFNKILYIEKKGLWPVIQAAKIAERYDMAVVASEGFATEACRELFRAAHHSHKYRIYVLHDADPAGYEIARTLAEETSRMPGYQIEVTDLGLSLEYALSVGLETEKFIRKKELPSALLPRLTKTEKKYFIGEKEQGSKHYQAQRVELNAFTSKQLVGFIESKLIENGADIKVIPSVNKFPRLVDSIIHNIVQDRVKSIVSSLIDIDGITNRIKSELAIGVDREAVIDSLNKQKDLSWDNAIEQKVIFQMDALKTIPGIIRNEVIHAMATITRK